MSRKYFTPIAMAMIAVLPAIAQTAMASPSDGDFVLLSDEYAGRTYINLFFDGRNLPPEPIEAYYAKAMTGAQISDLFAGLCLTKLFDREAYEAARATIGSDFRSLPRNLEEYAAARPLVGVKKVAGTQITQEHSDYGIASLWLGEGADSLERRFKLSFTGGLVITGPVKAKNLYAPQCSVTLQISGLTSATALLDGLQKAATGFVAGKRVDKPKFGSGVWTKSVEGGRTARLSVTADKLNKPEQTVHVTVQLLPSASSKK